MTFRRWVPILLVTVTTASGAVAAALASVAGNAASQDLPWFVEMKRHYQWWLAASITATVIATLLAWWAQRRYDRPTGTPAGDSGPADAVSAQLVVGIGRQLRAEEGVQQIHDPWPIPVPVDVTGLEVMDHWQAIRGDPQDKRPLALAGEVSGIAAIFAHVPSGRMVLLGPAGAGKSVAARRLAVTLSESWTSLDPIPVMAHLSSWDVPGQSLAGWLEQHIVDDHPGLAGHRGLIRELIDHQRLLLVLDGLDEIDPRFRAAALLAINKVLVPGQHLVLTSRIEEFAAAVGSSDVVSGAAVLELADLDGSTAFDYLAAAVPPVTARRWATVRAATGTNTILVEVLRSPLYLAMARAVYGGSTAVPEELLDGGIRGGRAAIERTLLAGYTNLALDAMCATGPARLRERRRASARRWLQQIAVWARAGAGDIAWWELPRLMPNAVAGLLWATITAVLAGLLWMSFAAAYNPSAVTALSGVLVGVSVGAVAGCLLLPASAETGITFTVRGQSARVAYGPVLASLEVAIALTAILANGRNIISGAGHVLRCALIAVVVGFLTTPGWGGTRRDRQMRRDARWIAIVVSGLTAGLAVYASTVADSTATLADTGHATALMTLTVAVLVGAFAAAITDRAAARTRARRGAVQRGLRWLPAGVVVVLMLAVYTAETFPYAGSDQLGQSWGQRIVEVATLVTLLIIAGRYLASTHAVTVRQPYRITPARRGLAGSVLTRMLTGSIIGFCGGILAETGRDLAPFPIMHDYPVALVAHVDGPQSFELDLTGVGVLVGAAVGIVAGLDDWLRRPAEDSDLPTARAVLRADRTVALVSLVLPIVLLPIATDSGWWTLVTSDAALPGWEQWALYNEHPSLHRVLSAVPETWLFNLPATLLAVCAPALLFLILPMVLASWRKLAWPQYQLARVWLAVTGRTPWRLIAFLERARGAGLLRQVGGVYQFRHLRLAEYAETSEDTGTSPAGRRSTIS
ncbi:NACHT domain-containing protein [Actinoplanes sp. NPDC026670]|uniref:NACHT domain-containing protein n=1 Tax=Actinoplanes sp. NPDC026670 TaxID=3154700 RepID=UPI0033E49077